MAFTYFFRDLQTLDLIVEHVISFSMGRSKIHVWDAGCTSGLKLYSKTKELFLKFQKSWNCLVLNSSIQHRK